MSSNSESRGQVRPGATVLRTGRAPAAPDLHHPSAAHGALVVSPADGIRVEAADLPPLGRGHGYSSMYNVL